MGRGDDWVRPGFRGGWLSQYFEQHRRFYLFRGADFLNAFEQAQRNALGMFFVRLHSQGNFINEIFWGLWLFPFGLLVFRSGFLPRIIGAWLMINCFAWLVLSPMALFAPSSYYDAAFRYAQPFLFGELAIMLWLLIKDVKVQPSPEPVSAVA
jgi:hypothetical protein